MIHCLQGGQRAAAALAAGLAKATSWTAAAAELSARRWAWLMAWGRLIETTAAWAYWALASALRTYTEASGRWTA